MNKEIELLKKHLLSPIVINEETQNAILMAIEALEQKPPVISDEDIINESLRVSLNGSEALSFQDGAEWMRKLLTNKD